MPFGIAPELFEQLPIQDQILIAQRAGQTVTNADLVRTEQPSGTEGTVGLRTNEPAPVSPDPGGSPNDDGGGGGGTTGVTNDPVEPEVAADIPRVQIYGGARWVQITDNPSGTDAATKWIAIYDLPGGAQVFFEASPEEMQAIFGKDGRPASFQTMPQREFDRMAQVEGESIYFGGQISEMESTTGESFQSAFERSVAAGLGTDSLPAELRNDPAIIDILFLAQQEQWSDEKMHEELAKTDAFKQRFPHLNVFRDQGLDVLSSVRAYREYENRIDDLNLKYEGRRATQDEKNAVIGRRHSMELVERTYRTFERFEENERSLAAFNQVLTARGLQPMDAEGMFDFIEGNAAPELYDIYAESSILEAGQAAGFDLKVFNTTDVRELRALMGDDVTFEAAYEGLSQAAKLALQFRSQVDLGQLNTEDLIDLSLGLAPRSGKDQAEIQQDMERFMLEAQTFLRRRARPYVGYTDEGVPERPGLSRLRQQT